MDLHDVSTETDQSSETEQSVVNDRVPMTDPLITPSLNRFYMFPIVYPQVSWQYINQQSSADAAL